MLLDPSNRLVRGLGTLRIFGGGDLRLDRTWSTVDQPAYRSYACSIMEILEGSGGIEIDGRWWLLTPGRIVIVPCRHLLRRRTTGMRVRWIIWGCASLADDLLLARCGDVLLTDSSDHRPWSEALASASKPAERVNNTAIEGLLLQAAAALLAAGARGPRPPLADPLVDAAMAWIDQRHPRSTSMGALARALGKSSSLIHARFAAVLGMSPGAYARERRMHDARQLLATTDLSVGDIAQRCGYVDPLHFSRVVRKHCGNSPINLRRQLHAELGIGESGPQST